MAKNDFDFYEEAAKSAKRYENTGCCCGCLTGLIVLGSIIVTILTPSRTFDKIGDEWQKSDPNAQKVIETKRPYHTIQNSPKQRQRN